MFSIEITDNLEVVVDDNGSIELLVWCGPNQGRAPLSTEKVDKLIRALNYAKEEAVDEA